ncbi:MAG: CbtB-domain containing protein [Gammaproteobacteria bacterium]|nr:MAG: CbtB-domain containing protein [Gammaproteobacteria bacterium]
MQNQTSTVASHDTAAVPSTISKPLQLAGAFLLGAIIIYAAGFLSTPVAHSAAHDTRHSQAFPCH